MDSAAPGAAKQTTEMKKKCEEAQKKAGPHDVLHSMFNIMI